MSNPPIEDAYRWILLSGQKAAAALAIVGKRGTGERPGSTVSRVTISPRRALTGSDSLRFWDQVGRIFRKGVRVPPALCLLAVLQAAGAQVNNTNEAAPAASAT